MQLWYWVREYSESTEFPEVHIFSDETEARETMVREAIEVRQILDPAWITKELDGPAITYCLEAGGHLSRTVNSLNVQRDGGAVDCFRLHSQEVAA